MTAVATFADPGTRGEALLAVGTTRSAEDTEEAVQDAFLNLILFHTAILLRDVEGWSSGEIAETLGISVAAVKTRVHRAQLFLRKRLAAAVAP